MVHNPLVLEVNEQFHNDTSAYKRPFSATNVLGKNNYAEEMRRQINLAVRSKIATEKNSLTNNIKIRSGSPFL